MLYKSESMKYYVNAQNKDKSSIVDEAPMGHSGEYGNATKLVGKMSKSVMQLISFHF